MNIRLSLLALLLLLAGCGRHSDAQLQGKLLGTWTTTNGYSKNTITVGPTGAYDCQVIARNSTDGITRTYILSGTMEVRKGLLIETITKHSQSNAPLPMISTSSIVRLDGHELVIKYPPAPPGTYYPTNEIVFRKE